MHHKRYKKHNILHLENIKKIGNVLERILIYHKKYKKDNILHLDNIVKSEMFGKEHLFI
jgi:nitrate reductase NapAB chaperone NapD